MKTYRVISRKSLVSDIEVKAESQTQAEEMVGEYEDHQMQWEDDEFEITDCYEDTEA